MIKIEVLYPEYANLYGDTGNMRYLFNVLEDVELIYTGINEEPKFLSQEVNMIYLGPTTESAQEEIISKLMKYKQQIEEVINSGVFVLAIGNSLEIFGEYIQKTNGDKIKGLGIFNIYAKRIKDYRHNDLVLGKTKEGLEIVGFKNQMSHIYGEDENCFLELSLGSGRNIDEKKEGIRYKNFIGSYVLGPILPLNPEFTEYIIKIIGGKEKGLEIKEEASLAYKVRLEEYKQLIRKKAYNGNKNK